MSAQRNLEEEEQVWQVAVLEGSLEVLDRRDQSLRFKRRAQALMKNQVIGMIGVIPNISRSKDKHLKNLDSNKEKSKLKAAKKRRRSPRKRRREQEAQLLTKT